MASNNDGCCGCIVAGIILKVIVICLIKWNVFPIGNPNAQIPAPEIKENLLRPDIGGSTRGSDDDVLSRRLVGSWEGSVATPQIRISGIDTYFPDKTFTFAGTMTMEGKTTAISWNGTWRIEGKIIQEKITQSSVPFFLPVGKAWSDDIITLTSDEFVTRDPINGTTETRRRVSK